MYRQYEPGQDDDAEMERQPQQNMYNHMDYEDMQQMKGGRPMYCYPMPYDYPEQGMYQEEPEEGWWNQSMPMYQPEMMRQPIGIGYGYPRRRRRHRRRRRNFFFFFPPFYHYGPRSYFDGYDDDDDDDYSYDHDRFDDYDDRY